MAVETRPRPLVENVVSSRKQNVGLGLGKRVAQSSEHPARQHCELVAVRAARRTQDTAGHGTPQIVRQVEVGRAVAEARGRRDGTGGSIDRQRVRVARREFDVELARAVYFQARIGI